MKKAVKNQVKPVVDEAELDRLAKEHEDKPEEKEIPEERAEDKDPEEVKEEPEVVKVEVKEEVDYKEKFKESSREAMVLKKQLDDIELEKAKKIVIDEAFMKAKYSDWEELTIGEQKALTKTEQLDQQIQEINNRTNEFNNDKKWLEKVDAFIDDDAVDQFPQLKSREEQFRKFATRPSRKGLPIDDLVKIFLWENPEVVKAKRSLFHSPGGPDKAPVKSEEMTPEEVATLRKTDNRKYMQMIKEGKIKFAL